MQREEIESEMGREEGKLLFTKLKGTNLVTVYYGEHLITAFFTTSHLAKPVISKEGGFIGLKFLSKYKEWSPTVILY
jgi:hypothetical protein